VISASTFSSEQKIMRPTPWSGVSKPSFIGLTASQRLRIFSLTQNIRDRKRSVAPSSTCDPRAIVQPFNDDGVELFRPAKVKLERYRYRGARILLPWMESGARNGRSLRRSAFTDRRRVGVAKLPTYDRSIAIKARVEVLGAVRKLVAE
jgi:hypothetical protein